MNLRITQSSESCLTFYQLPATHLVCFTACVQRGTWIEDGHDLLLALAGLAIKEVTENWKCCLKGIAGFIICCLHDRVISSMSASYATINLKHTLPILLHTLSVKNLDGSGCNLFEQLPWCFLGGPEQHRRSLSRIDYLVRNKVACCMDWNCSSQGRY